MTQVRPIASTPVGGQQGAVGFLAKLVRLQGEVREVGRQLDRIEAEMRESLNDVARERFEEYR